MNFLTLTESKLPPGFRFHPRDDELVCDYLAKKISSDDSGVVVPAMVEVDLNKCEPWELPETARVGGKEWYFFSQRDRKYATGLRTNRATASGYWKATGKDRQVYHAQTGELVGMRKTLVFYQGRAPKGRKSDWVMHEFRVEGWSPPSPPPAIPFKEDWVLCRVFHKTRGSSDKSSTENGYYEETTSSSPLPALVEDPCLQIEGYEHGPCFSRFNQGHTSYFEGITDMNLNLYSMPKLEDCLANDEEVLKAVLDHLTQPDEHVKLEVPIATIGERSSFSRFKHQSLNHESYLPDIDIMQNMWKSYE